MSGTIPRLRLFCLLVVAVILSMLTLLVSIMERRTDVLASYAVAGEMVSLMGLSDLALSTEARYTRHPAVSDEVVPFMDHPGALEHFPSGSFFRPVQ